MIIISGIIALIYLALIGSFVYGFDKVKPFYLEDIAAKTTFSIIIPFRNEAKNLPDLLKSILALNYPKHLFEVILVDDDSEDDSADIITKFLLKSRSDIKILKNKRATNSPKKDAISTAIKHAQYNWIVTTDADCVLPEHWLDSFDQCIQKTNAKCIAAPVTYTKMDTFLNRFQMLDLLSLQGATVGGFGICKPFLCNGANFAYKKTLFIELNGFEGNETIASGDDIFLLEKMVKSYPKALYYLKCKQAIVATQPQSTWTDLISQHLRWAAKTSGYNNWFGKLTGSIVLIMNGLFISIIPFVILSVISWTLSLYILLIKLYIDFLLINKTVSFFNKKTILKSYLIAFFVYPFFSVYVAFIAMFSNYKWKGRVFKK